VEVTELTGATYRQLDYWCSQGLFGEDLMLLGSGMKRRFDRTTLFHVAVVVRVAQALESLTQSKFRGSVPLSRDVIAVLNTPSRSGNVSSVESNRWDTASPVFDHLSALKIKCGEHSMLTIEYSDLRRKFEEL
jgi:hypothetical protein